MQLSSAQRRGCLVVVQFEDPYQGMPLGMPHIGEIEEQLPRRKRHRANAHSTPRKSARIEFQLTACRKTCFWVAQPFQRCDEASL
jgi:hypothetical protein